MTTLLILRGAPAAGKTTDAKTWLNAATNRIRVGSDEIRAMLGYPPFDEDAEHERRVTILELAAVSAGLNAGYDVVSDSTNLNPLKVQALQAIASEVLATIEYRDFSIGLDAAVFRDEDRTFDGGRSMGRRAITWFFDNYIPDGYKLEPLPKFELSLDEEVYENAGV